MQLKKQQNYVEVWQKTTKFCKAIILQLKKKKEGTELDMEKWTGSKLGKEYIKAVYHHPAYLTYMQSTSWKMLGWMKHKL